MHPVYGGTRITIQPVITVNEEYSDNLFLSDKDKEEDIVSLISPGFIAEASSRTSELTFSYNFGYSHYKRFSEYDAWRHNSQLKGIIGLSKYTKMQFSNSFILTEDPEDNIEDRGEEESAEPQRPEAEKETIRRNRYRYYNNSSRVSMTHQFGKTDFFTLAYTCDRLKNEDMTIRNEVKHRPSFSFTYWPLPNRLGLDGEVFYSRDDIADAKDDPGYLEENLVPSIFLTYWWIPGKLRIQPGLSYEKGVNNSDTGEASDNWHESISPSAKTMYRFSPHSTVETETYFTKAITYTSEGLSDPSDDFKIWYGSLKLSHRFHRRFEAYIRYAVSETKYEGKGDEDNEDYLLHEPSVGITYILAEGLPLNLSVGYLTRERDIAGKESAITLNGNLGTWKFCRYGSLTFNAASGYNEDNFGAESLGFGFFYNADIKAEYVFSENISGNLYGRYQRNSYLDNEENGGDTRDDKTWEIGSGLIYRPEKWWSVSLDYVYRNVNSTESEDSYEDNRVFLKMGLSPSRGIRIW